MKFDDSTILSRLKPVDPSLQELRQRRFADLAHERFQSLHQAIAESPPVTTQHLVCDQDVVEIGLPEELTADQHANLMGCLEAFIPWKKGPFSLFGHHIDAEWRSDWKWQRLLDHMHPLQDHTVADIGCNNGYFMYRMLAEDPFHVVGFEPCGKNYLNFALLQHFCPSPKLSFDLLGVEHIDSFPLQFDTVFCLGILYHHTDPIGLLRKIFKALKPGGQLLVECQGVLQDGSYALVPHGRYAQARGIWFLPTPDCLLAWLKRANFSDIEIFSSQQLSTEEQRTTRWAPIPSLKDFLDPNNPALTIEGYPAPARIYACARR